MGRWQVLLIFGRKHPKGCLEQVREIKELCLQYKLPLVVVALQWCTRHPQVATAIPGAAFPNESRQNTEAGNYEIPKEFWKELEPLIRHWDIPGLMAMLIHQLQDN